MQNLTFNCRHLPHFSNVPKIISIYVKTCNAAVFGNPLLCMNLHLIFNTSVPQGPLDHLILTLYITHLIICPNRLSVDHPILTLYFILVHLIFKLHPIVKLSGTLFLYQAEESSPLIITGVVYNVDPDGLHGFHVHQFGNLSDSCKGAGAHFNPTGVSLIWNLL
jgi:hypothetical protein